MGGTLEAEVQRGDGRLDHRSRKVEDMDVKYGPVHAISITPGGQLEGILGKRETMVDVEASVRAIIADVIARFLTGLKIEQVPKAAIEAAKRSIIDTPEAPKVSEATELSLILGLFQHFLNSIRYPVLAVDQFSPIPREVPQILNVCRRHEAASQQPVL